LLWEMTEQSFQPKNRRLSHTAASVNVLVPAPPPRLLLRPDDDVGLPDIFIVNRAAASSLLILLSAER
jgi:hypothetical protein